MKSALILLISVFMITLVVTSPVEAGFWDTLFKNLFKSDTKTIVKEVDNAVSKQADEAIGKKSDKALEKTAEQKTLSKQEQIAVNKEVGAAYEEGFKLAWCKRRTCIDKPEKEYLMQGYGTKYITNNYMAQNFIRQKFDKDFIRIPDMLEVKTGINNIRSIKIYDVKSSELAYDVAQAQKEDFLRLCDNLNKKSDSSNH